MQPEAPADTAGTEGTEAAQRAAKAAAARSIVPAEQVIYASGTYIGGDPDQAFCSSSDLSPNGGAHRHHDRHGLQLPLPYVAVDSHFVTQEQLDAEPEVQSLQCLVTMDLAARIREQPARVLLLELVLSSCGFTGGLPRAGGARPRRAGGGQRAVLARRRRAHGGLRLLGAQCACAYV